MTKQLPGYFKNYLDEKFAHTDDKINVVDAKVNGVQKELESVNGCVQELIKQEVKSDQLRKTLIPDYQKTKKKVSLLIVSVIILTVLFILFVEESRVILSTVFSGLF